MLFRSFTAPDIDTATETLTFQLTVTDNEGGTDADSVSVTVNNVVAVADITVNIDRVDPAGSFTLALSIDGTQAATEEVAADDSQVIFGEAPQGADFAVTIASAPDAPASCTVSNGSGTVAANGNTVSVQCVFVVADMGMQTALEQCVSDNGSKPLLGDVDEELDCSERGISNLDGVEFLATRLEEFDVSNNALTNAEIPKLHALVNLEFLAIGGNDEVFNNKLIAALEDALIDTDINYSNLNTALVRFFKFDLTFSAEALAIPEQIGTLRLVTDYWPADEPDKAFIFREFSEPVSLLLETTAGDMLMGDMGMNQDVFTRALSYIVDLTRINAALSCNAEATVSSDVSGYPSLPE